MLLKKKLANQDWLDLHPGLTPTQLSDAAKRHIALRPNKNAVFTWGNRINAGVGATIVTCDWMELYYDAWSAELMRPGGQDYMYSVKGGRLAGETLGGLGGSIVGAKWGAMIGAPLGPLGMAICGILGAGIGGIGGAWLYGEVGEDIGKIQYDSRHAPGKFVGPPALRK